MNDYKFILASSSPRRKEILKNMNIEFDVVESNINELEINNDLCVCDWVKKVCEMKGEAVFDKIKNDINENTIIISADTIVVYMDNILHKPKNKLEAKKMISMLSGNCHTVYTALSLLFLKDEYKKRETFISATNVFMNKLDDSEIEYYINTNEPYDKAGGYGIQGIASMFINRIDGDYYTVVGFPISIFYNALKNNNINIMTKRK